MANNRTNFSISNGSRSIKINTPLQVSYLVDDKFTVDNTTGMVYPNFAVTHSSVYSLINKIYDIINEKHPRDILQYRQWNWDTSYTAGSMVYVYDKASEVNKNTASYSFYKVQKITNPLIKPSNTNFWSGHAYQEWDGVGEYSYDRGTIVHRMVLGNDQFYECLVDTTSGSSLSETSVWRKLDIKTWEYDKKYNAGSRVHLTDSGKALLDENGDSSYISNMVYTSLKTVLPATKQGNREYLSPLFDHYALINIVDDLPDDYNAQLSSNLIDLSESITLLRDKFRIDTSTMVDDEITLYYNDINNKVDNIVKDDGIWNIVINSYANMLASHDPLDARTMNLYALLWRNIRDLGIYLSELKTYQVDPIRALSSLTQLSSFKVLEEYNLKNNTGIVAYVRNLQDTQDPSQVNGGYFIYDTNRKRFIKALVGGHEHVNKDIIDEITQSFDETYVGDDKMEKTLVIRKETDPSDMTWKFHAQWKNVDVLPDKPADSDSQEYILATGRNGQLEWTTGLGNSASFIKKVESILEDSNQCTFNVNILVDDIGNISDSMLVYRNGVFMNDNDISVRAEGDDTLIVSAITPITPALFSAGDVVTLILVRNTSVEMLSNLSDKYISKKEALELVSNGNISLNDYVKKSDLARYSLKNHSHTRYSNKDHLHTGIYADYHHNHDGLYTTRDDISDMLSNILSISPELVNIINSISLGAEDMSDLFIDKVEYQQFIDAFSDIDMKMTTIGEGMLYIDDSDGSIYRKISSENPEDPDNPIITIDKNINIKSYQISTNMSVDGALDGSTYNLEEWLDIMLTQIGDEQDRINRVVSKYLKDNKYTRTYELSSRSNVNISLSAFNITDIRLQIVEEFEDDISVLINGIEMISADNIMHDTQSMTNYTLNKRIGVNETVTISFDLGSFDNTLGHAKLNISGYGIA